MRHTIWDLLLKDSFRTRGVSLTEDCEMARGVLMSRLPTQLVNASSSIQISAGRARLIQTSIYTANKVEFTKMESRPAGKEWWATQTALNPADTSKAVWVGSGVGTGASGAQKRPHGPAGTISYRTASDDNHTHLTCYASDASLPSLWEMVKMSNRFSVYSFTIFLIFTKI